MATQCSLRPDKHKRGESVTARSSPGEMLNKVLLGEINKGALNSKSNSQEETKISVTVNMWALMKATTVTLAWNS